MERYSHSTVQWLWTSVIIIFIWLIMSSPTYLPIFQYCVCTRFFIFLIPLNLIYSEKATWWNIPVDLSSGSYCHIFVGCFRIFELQWSNEVKVENWRKYLFSYIVNTYLNLRQFFSGYLVKLNLPVRRKFCPSDSISNKDRSTMRQLCGNENCPSCAIYHWTKYLPKDKMFIVSSYDSAQ